MNHLVANSAVRCRRLVACVCLLLLACVSPSTDAGRSDAAADMPLAAVGGFDAGIDSLASPLSHERCRFVNHDKGLALDVWAVDASQLQRLMIQSVTEHISTGESVEVPVALANWLQSHGKRDSNSCDGIEVVTAQFARMQLVAAVPAGIPRGGIARLALAAPYGQDAWSIALLSEYRATSSPSTGPLHGIDVRSAYQQWDASGRLTGEIVDFSGTPDMLVAQLQSRGIAIDAHASGFLTLSKPTFGTPLALLQPTGTGDHGAARFFVQYFRPSL